MNPADDYLELEGVVDAAKDARIVIMNPPFTNRAKMGEKFPQDVQGALRGRVDNMERILTGNDPALAKFGDKNSIAPLFIALADKCMTNTDSILTMIIPTIVFCNPSGLEERRILAQRYHIHTVLTCHQPRQINQSQNTNINESLIVAIRHAGVKLPTKFINLDRLPFDDAEVDDLHRCLSNCAKGIIANGWGEICEWSAEMIDAGDWTPAIWRSPELAQAAAGFANDANMQTLAALGMLPTRTAVLKSTGFERVEPTIPGSFPVLDSKGADGQQSIQSRPDAYWIPKERDEQIRVANGGTYPEADKVLQKVGRLLITTGQDNSTARLTAVADDIPYVGNGYMPFTDLSEQEAKALAVFLNSTAGRLQLMRNIGRKLSFPIYNPAGIGNIRIPDVMNGRIRQILSDCWGLTRDMVVPQFRDGECEVRQIWDKAVAMALSWDDRELEHLRLLLHIEPHVRGLGYNQYGDEIEVLEQFSQEATE